MDGNCPPLHVSPLSLSISLRAPSTLGISFRPPSVCEAGAIAHCVSKMWVAFAHRSRPFEMAVINIRPSQDVGERWSGGCGIHCTRLSSFVCNENVANLESTHALQTETPLMYSCTLYCALSRLARAQVFPRLRSSPFPLFAFRIQQCKK